MQNSAALCFSHRSFRSEFFYIGIQFVFLLLSLCYPGHFGTLLFLLRVYLRFMLRGSASIYAPRVFFHAIETDDFENLNAYREGDKLCFMFIS